MTAFFSHFVTQHGYLALAVAMFIEGLGFPLPAELLFIPAGFLISRHQLHLPALILAGSIGGVAGNFTTYAASRWGGRRFLERYGHVFRLDESKLNQVGKWFSRYGGKTVFVSRFIGFIRAAAIVTAGISRMPLLEFAGYQFLAALVWNTLWGVATWRFGRRVIRLEHHIGRIATLALAAVGVAAVLAFILWRRRNHGNKQN
ncbi:MAG: DedA family protein [Symbiobacteriia bacterium]